MGKTWVSDRSSLSGVLKGWMGKKVHFKYQVCISRSNPSPVRIRNRTAATQPAHDDRHRPHEATLFHKRRARCSPEDLRPPGHQHAAGSESKHCWFCASKHVLLHSPVKPGHLFLNINHLSVQRSASTLPPRSLLAVFLIT